MVTNLVPDPGNLTNNFTEVSVTFDRPMDITTGRIEIQTDIFDNEQGWSVTDPELAWNGAATKLTFTPPAAPDPSTDSAIARFTDLKKANGDHVPDVYLPIVLDRTGAESVAPVLDSPDPGQSGTITLNPAAPILWFSDAIDPGTLQSITAADSGGAPIALSPSVALFGRGITVSTAAMTPGEIYTVTIGTGLLDNAGNALASEVTFDVQIDAGYTPGSAQVVGVADGATDLPLDALALFVRMPEGTDPASIGPDAIRLLQADTLAPVRGVSLSQPPVAFPETAFEVVFPAGTTVLEDDQAYRLVVDHLTGPGGVDVFPVPLELTFTTVDRDLGGDPNDARPLFDGFETSLTLTRSSDVDVELSAALGIIDDSASLTVRLTGLDGDIDLELVEDMDDPGVWTFLDGDVQFTDPGFSEGYNTLTFEIDDGVRTTLLERQVYFVPDDEIPEITTIANGSTPTLSEAQALALEWTHTVGPADRQVVALLAFDAMFGGEPTIVDFTFLDADATSFDFAERFGPYLQAGSTYGVFVLKQVSAPGEQDSAGDALVFEQNAVLFTVADPALGSISGAINFLASIAGDPVVLLFDQPLGSGVDPVAGAAARATADPLVYDYSFVNLDAGTYYVVAITDIAGDDVDGDPITQSENLAAFYGTGFGDLTPIVVDLGGTKDITGIVLDANNYPGRINVSVTSDVAIDGDVDIVLCTPAATNPPLDGNECRQAGTTPFAQSTTGTVTAYYVDNGTYSVWVIPDMDDDEQAENQLRAEASASVVVNDDVHDFMVSFTVPTAGSISGTITSSVTIAGQVAVFVFNDGDTFGDPFVSLVIADGAEPTWTYDIPFMPNGDYDVIVIADDDGSDPPLGANENPVSVTVSDDAAVADFTLGT